MIEGHVHIYRGTNPTFAAVVRAPGARKYRIVGKWTKSEKKAWRMLTAAMLDRKWKRGALLYMTDYYDPIALLRIER